MGTGGITDRHFVCRVPLAPTSIMTLTRRLRSECRPYDSTKCHKVYGTNASGCFHAEYWELEVAPDRCSCKAPMVRTGAPKFNKHGSTCLPLATFSGTPETSQSRMKSSLSEKEGMSDLIPYRSSSTQFNTERRIAVTRTLPRTLFFWLLSGLPTLHLSTVWQAARMSY